MAKYLIKATYTTKGAKGLLKEGGSSRKSQIEKMAEGLDGRLEAFYYAFGECDAYAIIDVPDVITVTAVSLTINASGAVNVQTVALLTPEEVDQATKKSVSYRAPGV